MKALLLIAFLSSASAWAGECFDVTPEDGELGFEIDQAGTTFSGSFSRFHGSVCRDAGTLVRVRGWVEPGSVQAGLPEMEDALRGEDFFDVDSHPRATFESSSIEKTPDGYLAHGNLDLKGISRPVDVSFRLSDDGQTVAGSLALKRLDFQIGTGEWADTRWVGETATVTFSGRLAQAADD